jgi:hypothetical protein
MPLLHSFKNANGGLGLCVRAGFLAQTLPRKTELKYSKKRQTKHETSLDAKPPLLTGNHSCSAISFRVISIKLLLEIIDLINSRLLSNIFNKIGLGIFQVRTTINFSGCEFNRKDSRKSLSLVITILFSLMEISIISLSDVEFLFGKSSVRTESKPL